MQTVQCHCSNGDPISAHALSPGNTAAEENRILRLFLGLLLMLMICSPGALRADAGTNQFLFLTIQIKGGVLTMQKASVVAGSLKPQQDSKDAEALVVALEDAEGKDRWSLAMEDPTIQRLEYEDPQHPGVIKSTVTHLDDVEFIARVPLMIGVRHVAIYRKEKNVPPTRTGAPSADKRLLHRIELPKEATK
ncbi:MAG: hypothetical protein JWM68_4041 [Verrucomicrobiales bacterium]|nr:hypothetical protein [Verrucomicrobiales bacterium]